MTAEELTFYYYNDIIGHNVNENDEQVTFWTLQYLLDNGLEEQEIIALLQNVQFEDNIISPDTLPDSLWIVNPKIKENKTTGQCYEVNDNLVKRNEFYYHPRLMLRSKMPHIVKGKEIVEPYYCEPRCRFTIHDLIMYFCSEIRTEISYMDSQYSINSILKTLSVYQDRYKTINPIDIMLYSIDIAAQNGNYGFSTFMQLQQYTGIVVEDINTCMAHVRAYGYDKIVWRSDKWRLQK